MSDLAELTDGRVYGVLAEPGIDDSKVTRLILCTGKIYYDLVAHVDRAAAEEIAIGRVEVLYPFPEQEPSEPLRDAIRTSREVAWAQEEPRNMGARAHMSQRLRQIISDSRRVAYSVAPSARARARATRRRTPRSRRASCGPRSTSASRCRSSRCSSLANGSVAAASLPLMAASGTPIVVDVRALPAPGMPRSQ